MRLFVIGFLSLVGVIAGAQVIDGALSAAQKPIVPNNRWAVVIGVSNYSNEIGALKYTAKEARDFYTFLHNDLKFEPDNTRLLADGGTPEEAPTSAHILAALETLLADKRLDKANLFVFYFSGHGVGTATGDYLLPADAKKGQFEAMGVPVREVISRIVKAGLKNVLFIADACRAGNENPFGDELNTLCRKSNIAVILGCAPGKRSYEYPSLQQGAFTHFLIEGLKKPELRDLSGALWASKLGEHVQKTVHDFTERDHGKYAQVPALWGESTTLDVLIAAYPQSPISDAAVQSFKTKAEKLGKTEYAAAITSYATSLYDGDRFDQAVDLLKTVDQLGEITPMARITLASALDTLGRTGEAEKVYAAFQSEPEGYWKDFAFATSCSRDLDPALRIKAAMRLFDTDPNWSLKLMAWNVIDRWGTYEQKLSYAKRLATVKDATARQSSYGKAQVANLLGNWSESIKYHDLAAQSPGEFPTDYIIFLSKLGPLLMLGDEKQLETYLQAGEKDGRNVGFAYIERAQIAKNKGDVSARLKYLKLALAKELNPEFLLLAARVAGPYIGSLQEEFKSAALRHPYSWRARMILYFVRKIQGDPAMEGDRMAIDRYMDDPLSFNSKLFDFMDVFMSEAIQLKRLPLETYRSQLDLYFLMLKDAAPQFGYDVDLWMQLMKYGMFNERNTQVNQVVARFLPLKPESTPKELRPMFMLLAMNRGDSATVTQLFKTSFEPTERRDPAWMVACYEATLGHIAAAQTLVAHVASPSSELAARMEAFSTYLLAKAGKSAAARKRLAKPTEDIIAKAWNGLSWAALGEWKRAEPLLAIQARDRDWTYLFVQEFAMRTLDQRFRQTGRLEEARQLAFSALISQPGNPLFARYSFAKTPGIQQFAGSVELIAQAIDDKDPNLSGLLKLDVSVGGKVVGVFVGPEGKRFVLAGSVDAYGNVSGTSDWNSRKCTLTGKIAPPSLYPTFASFQNPGQLLQLVDEEGYRIAILGRMKPAPKTAKPQG